MPAAAIAFWNRTANCSRDRLDVLRLQDRTLVRMWGQRRTVHLYWAEDWPFLHAAFLELQTVMAKRIQAEGYAPEFRRFKRGIAKRLEKGEHLTHKDIQSKKLQ